MRVLCIKGEEGYLKENEVYFVREVTEKGNYKLFEVDPPHPFTSFSQNRFVPLEEYTDEELQEMFEGLESIYGGD